ncbi:MAG TPA: glycosyltransferase family 4 protein [Cyclobacteriaceae bacterium]|nr:glycosyltransferase family 4 protein [Cyclobacteriaceae bacterium]
MIRRPLDLFSTLKADFVFIHREALPLGPPLMEWFIAKVLKKKIIYDFDDAIWLTDKMEESFLDRTIRWRGKVASVCKWSYRISCGNEYLRQYGIQFNSRSLLNPTTIDSENQHNRELYAVQKDKNRIVIGWTGSHSTLKYLYLLESILQQIQNTFPQVDVLVIADKIPSMNLPRLMYKPWSKESEIRDLMQLHIGVMPLPDDEWSKGKCGFKALQYMALEIPAVASPVGVNKEIIRHEVDGYLCSSDEEWVSVLGKLIKSSSLRAEIGKAGRQTVIERYSVSSNSDNFLSLFE